MHQNDGWAVANICIGDLYGNGGRFAKFNSLLASCESLVIYLHLLRL